MEPYEGRSVVTHKRSGPNRMDQANGRPQTLWDEQVVLYLIRGGTNGRSWGEISKHYHGHVTVTALRNFLETLRAEGKVDRFQVPVASGSGKPRTVYRATTKLVESD
jgi:beta-phosphoglucomutase-like phosphatase (HAD superfamily)